MLKRKTFEELLEDRDIYTVKEAALILRYHPMHLTKLCRLGQIEHIEWPGRKQRWYLYARTVFGSRPRHAASTATRHV